MEIDIYHYFWQSDADIDEDFSFLQPMDLITKDVNELRRLVKERRRTVRKDREKESEKERDRERKRGRDSRRQDRDKDHVQDGEGKEKDEKSGRSKDEKGGKEKEEKSGREKDEKTGKEKDEKSGKEKDEKPKIQDGLSVKETIVEREEDSAVKNDETGASGGIFFSSFCLCIVKKVCCMEFFWFSVVDKIAFNCSLTYSILLANS